MVSKHRHFRIASPGSERSDAGSAFSLRLFGSSWSTGDSGDSDFDEALQWAVMTVLDDMMQLKYGSMDTWTSGLRVVTAATLETWDGTFGKRLLRKHGLCFQSKISTCSTVQRLAAASSSKSWL